MADTKVQKLRIAQLRGMDIPNNSVKLFRITATLPDGNTVRPDALTRYMPRPSGSGSTGFIDNGSLYLIAMPHDASKIIADAARAAGFEPVFKS